MSETGETDDKPTAPQDLTKQSWVWIARRAVRGFSEHQCTDMAAALTYYSVLSLFPALIALLSLLGLVGKGDETVKTLLGILRDVGADSVAKTLQHPLTQLSHTHTTAGFALVIGLASALWSASGYVGSFGRAMNRIYGVAEGRPFWKLRPAMIVVAFVAVVLAAAVAVALTVSGPAAQAVGNAIGVGSTAVLLWQIAKWPFILAAVALIVAILYYTTPNVSPPRFRWSSWGAGFAVIAWVLASAGFGFYVANFSSYDKTYGALAGAIVFLLWLWITNLALLFGGELDAELERGRELQAGLPAERDLQLQPRDTRQIEKAEEKHRTEVERNRRLRESRGESDQPEDQSPETASPERTL
jgi:membrane protein